MGNAITEQQVEEKLINRLTELGYEYITIENYGDVLTNFRKQISKLNEKKLLEAKGTAELSNTEFKRVLNRLLNHTIYDSAKILREQYTLDLDNGKTIYMDFLTDDPTKNIYQVAHQITMNEEYEETVEQENRYDVTILINGLPLVQIELKRPGVEINEAINQINRYRRKSFVGLFKYIQIFVVSNWEITKYCANTNENNVFGDKQDLLKSLVFYWTTDDNQRITHLIDFTNVFLTKDNITEMLTKYFVVKEKEPVLMVMRPYQIYAVRKAIHRVIISDMNGYIFHTTGSGKTLTSFKLATLLKNYDQIKKVIFLIDRKDLDDQTVDEYNSFEEGCVDNTDDTKNLVKALQNSSQKMIITTIQKMASALRSSKYAEIMDQYRNEKCVFIIDECHRSQFGKMNGDIKRHFRKANYIGFTGTPIFAENKSKDGRTTADIFSVPEGVDACIHKYMIKEAIADGNVLPFSVEYMRSINILSYPDKTIDIEKLDDPEYCKRHMIDMSNLYHDPERIKKISDDILTNLEKHTHPTGSDIYTAIFAIDKITTLMDYYHYMLEHNPKGYKIAAIFTYKANEDLEEEEMDTYSADYLQECMNHYNEMFGTDYDIKKFDAYRRDISKRMKQKDIPQIDLLLVVNMFLTGFDSKPTNTLILDKDLIWHSLVQAYSRTNRVHKKTKRFGQIITYRNIKKAQDQALKLYSGDGDPNDYLLKSYEFYLEEYKRNVDLLRNIAETPEKAGELQSEADQKLFILTFRMLSGILATLKTFSKFDWKDLEDQGMDEETYQAYKSWYLEYFDKQRRDPENHKTLVNVDFELELIRTDKINVVYILNLLKEINRNDKNEMDKSVDLILREIDRSDNAKLRYKREIMKSFIKERFYELDPDEDILSAYEEYERDSMMRNIETFASEHVLDEDIISDIIAEYFINPRVITDEEIRKRIEYKKYGLQKVTQVVSGINTFLKEMKELYTAEGI